MMPRVHRVTKPSGAVFKYHRKTRRPLPSDIPEDHPDFIAAWQAEENGKPAVRSRAKVGTVRAGCEAYLASREYHELSESYRPVIRRHVEAIATQGDTAMMRHLRAKHIAADLAPLSPAVAGSRRKAWRKLGAFWTVNGMVDADPSNDVKRKPMPRSDGHTEWLDGDLAAFRAHWPAGTPQRLACELIQWTGARCSDAVRIGPGMVSGGLLRFSQKKTGAEVNVPWTVPAFGLDHQRADLMACLEGHSHMVFLTTVHGKARSGKAVSGWFAEAARDAGLVGLTAHGLRKYRMNQMAEAGVPLLAMQSWVGHTTLAEVERYTRRASRRNVFLVNRSQSFTVSGDK